MRKEEVSRAESELFFTFYPGEPLSRRLKHRNAALTFFGTGDEDQSVWRSAGRELLADLHHQLF